MDLNLFQNCVASGNKTRKGTVVSVKGTLLNKKFIKYISLSRKFVTNSPFYNKGVMFVIFFLFIILFKVVQHVFGSLIGFESLRPRAAKSHLWNS